MKKGFTLLELLVVIIIVAILATLGLAQYGRITESMRAAEAKATLGDIRKLAAVYYQSHGTLTGIDTLEDLQIGPFRSVPLLCRPDHFFGYQASVVSATTLSMTATRCGGPAAPLGLSNGKGGDNGYVGKWITLTSDVRPNGSDAWTAVAPYN